MVLNFKILSVEKLLLLFFVLISFGNVKMLTSRGISSGSNSGPLSLGPLIFGSSLEEYDTALVAPIYQRRKP